MKNPYSLTIPNKLRISMIREYGFSAKPLLTAVAITGKARKFNKSVQNFNTLNLLVVYARVFKVYLCPFYDKYLFDCQRISTDTL